MWLFDFLSPRFSEGKPKYVSQYPPPPPTRSQFTLTCNWKNFLFDKERGLSAWNAFHVNAFLYFAEGTHSFGYKFPSYQLKEKKKLISI